MSLRILEHGFLFEQHSVKTQNISSSYDWEKCALKDLIPSFFSLNVEIILVFQVNWDNFVAESRWIPLQLFYLRLKLKKQNLIVMCHHWQGISRAVFRLSGIWAEQGLWPWLGASWLPLELQGGEKGELLPPNSVKGGDSSSCFTPDDLP